MGCWVITKVRGEVVGGAYWLVFPGTYVRVSWLFSGGFWVNWPLQADGGADVHMHMFVCAYVFTQHINVGRNQILPRLQMSVLACESFSSLYKKLNMESVTANCLDKLKWFIPRLHTSKQRKHESQSFCTETNPSPLFLLPQIRVLEETKREKSWWLLALITLHLTSYCRDWIVSH